MTIFKQRGYTLIELMITVAILSILIAMATPIFKDYVIKSKLVVIYDEANQFRVPYQLLMNEGSSVQSFTPEGLNMLPQTQHCNFVVTPPSATNDTIDAIKCNIRNISILNGQYISLNKTLDNSWHCHVSNGIPIKYLPDACRP